ncbi:hypothetical protein D7V64_17175, partial [Acinetobacter cumulans]
MSGASPQTSAIVGVNKELKAYESAVIQVKYRDVSGTNTDSDVLTLSNLKIDLSSGYDEQILTGSVKFTMGSDQYIDRSGTLYRAVDPATNSGIASGLIRYGTGGCEIEGWTPDTDNSVQLKSLTTTTDLPPVNKICFRTPMIPIRVQSLTVVATSLEYGQLTLTADEYGKIETSRAHGSVNYENGLVNIDFYTKTEISAANRAEIEAQDWYDVLLEYDDAGKTYINVPVWIDASAVRYNAVAYTYIPLDADVIGLSATRLPLDGRVPIFRVGGTGIVSASKSQVLLSAVAGQIYALDDQRIAWCELEDALGAKVSFDMYTVDYDYGKITLNGDFALGNMTAPLTAKYRYQDMGLIRDVQINGQLTFTKPLTHNYDAENTIVGSALIIDDMQARYTRKFVQQSWNSIWSDEATGSAISANYNDSIYPIQVTNQGAIQERWAIVFTDATNFRCIGEYSGQIGTGTINTDFFPLNPITNAPYFLIKKEGWG